MSNATSVSENINISIQVPQSGVEKIQFLGNYISLKTYYILHVLHTPSLQPFRRKTFHRIKQKREQNPKLKATNRTS